MYLGIDIGSSSSKAVLLGPDGKIAAEAVVNTGTGSKGPEKVVAGVMELAGISAGDIRKTVVTGYGRMIFTGADKQITEISCHARGVAKLYSNARTIIDIGGQDAKVIRLAEDGRVDNFTMNEKCAAGTGRFLEVMARVLDCSLSELPGLAEKSTEAVTISSTCTVFAESEVISQLAEGKKPEDVAMGAHRSIAERVEGLCKRVGVAPDVVMTGGVALNRSVAKALEERIGMPVIIPQSPQTIGALGAAVYAMDLDK